MRGRFADFSPAVPAAFSAGLGVALWIFLLPAGVVQTGPKSVVPAFGGPAGRVTADLPVPAPRRAPEVSTAVSSAHPQLAVALRPPAAKVRPAHHPARTPMVRRAPSARVREEPDTKSQLFSLPPKAKGKARGHERDDAQEPKAETPTPPSRGHGRALGRSDEREGKVPPGLAKKTSPAKTPKGGGNGRKGNDGGNGGKGNGDGDGDGRRGEED